MNKAAVLRLYEEAFAHGKPEVVDEVLRPDFACHDPNSETGAEKVSSAEARRIARWLDA